MPKSVVSLECVKSDRLHAFTVHPFPPTLHPLASLSTALPALQPVISHPSSLPDCRGLAEQLHKCIVSHSSGKGVFDGNVHVKRRAQKTDAQQLSRSLLLAPRATINIKPNLQIVADDVKCTHGAAISDLAEEELFYFR